MAVEEVRIDKWLWAVRIYKTRSLATEACKNGRVKIEGQPVKPSRMPKIGDVVEIHLNPLNKTVRVKALLHNRVGAKLVAEYLDDLTPAEEYERVELIREFNAEFRPRGTGRPTKSDRRQIDSLKNNLE
ncbi:MAG: RNA-binding S4 domain-containing protein [Bacteroidales bacterium]|jgi:ribosome-associated heat shock protein Hsp15|nr:RNA-binding S4 domain-containing protein [Bacteroidales bacterium]MDD3663968.1 RNA-binding S4 domain-containing protein [Bacteroidales bacterium]